ncbi:MAG: hypothetical protein ABSG28_08440 [Methanoregula sp.]|jgi:hypothetical protein|uniref:hypothetical protein n=1 Tax=Methanoregula sp. TaxID=2052170 RepID=UPI003C16F134
MASITIVQNQKPSQPSLTITREIFAALSPLDQIAARALEKCGLVQIVDQSEDLSPR